MKRTNEILQYVTGPTVLDIGCTGQDEFKENSKDWLHGLLLRNFPEVVGVDISDEDLRRLKALGIQNLYLQNAEQLNLPMTFNTIVAGEVIEHLSNPGVFLDKVYSHLKPDGRLIITTPNPFSILHMLYAFIKYPKTCSNEEHTCWFCPSTIRSLLKRYRFHEIHFDYVDDYQSYTPSWRFKLFTILIRIISPVLPKRLYSNAMILVLMKNESL